MTFWNSSNLSFLYNCAQGGCLMETLGFVQIMDCKWTTHGFIHCTFPFKSLHYTLRFVGSCWKQDWLRMLIFSFFLFLFLIDPHCKNHSYSLSGLKINLFPRFPSNRLLTQINTMLATALNPDGLDLFLHTSATPLW